MGSRRSKGLDVSIRNNAKPTDIAPKTESIRALNSRGSGRLKRATAAVHPAKINAQSNKEPSWAAHTALILYWFGS